MSEFLQCRSYLYCPNGETIGTIPSQEFICDLLAAEMWKNPAYLLTACLDLGSVQSKPNFGQYCISFVAGLLTYM